MHLPLRSCLRKIRRERVRKKAPARHNPVRLCLSLKRAAEARESPNREPPKRATRKLPPLFPPPALTLLGGNVTKSREIAGNPNESRDSSLHTREGGERHERREARPSRLFARGSGTLLSWGSGFGSCDSEKVLCEKERVAVCMCDRFGGH